MGPLRQRDGGAGLLVGAEVGKIVVLGEPLVVRARPDTAGHVLVPLDRVPPDPPQHPQKVRIPVDRRRHPAPGPVGTEPGGDIGDPGHQVGGPDGVALDVAMVADRNVVLPVGALVPVLRGAVLLGEELPAAILDEEPGQLEVPAFAGDPRQLHERQFDLRMPRIAHPLRRRTEHRIDLVGETPGDGEEIGLAGRLEVGHGRLEHVARAVQFVVVAEVHPAFAGFLHGVIAVQVSVLVLRRREDRDDLVQLPVQLRVRVRGQRVGRRFQGLVDVRIHEHRPLEPARRPFPRQPQVLQVLRLLQILQVDRDRRQPVCLPPRSPETVGNRDVGERNPLQPLQPRQPGDRRRSRPGSGHHHHHHHDRNREVEERDPGKHGCLHGRKKQEGRGMSGRWSVVGGRWSVVGGQWSVVSGRWSVVSGRWSVVSGRWSVVGGRWSVVGGRWSVVSGRWSVVGGQWSVVSGRWPVVGGQWSVVSGQWSVVRGQWSVVGGRWSVVSGRWSVVGGRWSVVGGQWSVVGGRWQLAGCSSSAICNLLFAICYSPRTPERAAP
jgi:hypothetical protein